MKINAKEIIKKAMVFDGRCDRVIINSHGEAVNQRRALQYEVVPDVVFMRSDGWVLGAPRVFERVAFGLWRDEWTHFIRRPNLNWEPISKYNHP